VNISETTPVKVEDYDNRPSGSTLLKEKEETGDSVIPSDYYSAPVDVLDHKPENEAREGNEGTTPNPSMEAIADPEGVVVEDKVLSSSTESRLGFGQMGLFGVWRDAGTAATEEPAGSPGCFLEEPASRPADERLKKVQAGVKGMQNGFQNFFGKVNLHPPPHADVMPQP